MNLSQRACWAFALIIALLFGLPMAAQASSPMPDTPNTPNTPERVDPGEWSVYLPHIGGVESHGFKPMFFDPATGSVQAASGDGTETVCVDVAQPEEFGVSAAASADQVSVGDTPAEQLCLAPGNLYPGLLAIENGGTKAVGFHTGDPENPTGYLAAGMIDGGVGLETIQPATVYFDSGWGNPDPLYGPLTLAQEDEGYVVLALPVDVGPSRDLEAAVQAARERGEDVPAEFDPVAAAGMSETPGLPPEVVRLMQAMKNFVNQGGALKAMSFSIWNQFPVHNATDSMVSNVFKQCAENGATASGFTEVAPTLGFQGFKVSSYTGRWMMKIWYPDVNMQQCMGPYMYLDLGDTRQIYLAGNAQFKHNLAEKGQDGWESAGQIRLWEPSPEHVYAYTATAAVGDAAAGTGTAVIVTEYIRGRAASAMAFVIVPRRYVDCIFDSVTGLDTCSINLQ